MDDFLLISIVSYVVYGIIFGFVCRYLAIQKGKDSVTWFWVGFILGIIGLLMVGFSKDESVLNKSGPNTNYERTSDFSILSTGIMQNEKIDLSAPVEIISYEILNSEKFGYYCNIKFLNLNAGTVNAVRLKVTGYNSFDEIIPVEGTDSFSVLIQDLNAKPGAEFTNINPIQLPNQNIRKLDIVVSQVRFADGHSINNDAPQIVELALKNIATPMELTIAQKILPSAQYYAEEKNNYWICSCGRPNRQGLEICARCNSQKEQILMNLTEKLLAEKARISIIEDNNRAQEFQKRKKKITRNIVVATIATLIIASISLIRINAINAAEEVKFMALLNETKWVAETKIDSDTTYTDYLVIRDSGSIRWRLENGEVMSDNNKYYLKTDIKTVGHKKPILYLKHGDGVKWKLYLIYNKDINQVVRIDFPPGGFSSFQKR